jgi:hypothetical protein
MLNPQTKSNERIKEYVPVATVASDSCNTPSVDDSVAVKMIQVPPDERIWKNIQAALEDDSL